MRILNANTDGFIFHALALSNPQKDRGIVLNVIPVFSMKINAIIIIQNKIT